MIATEVNGHRRIRCYWAIPRLGLAELREWLRALISLANTIAVIVIRKAAAKQIPAPSEKIAA
jgi:DNA-binding PadR family transcriptional regulator